MSPIVSPFNKPLQEKEFGSAAPAARSSTAMHYLVPSLCLSNKCNFSFLSQTPLLSPSPPSHKQPEQRKPTDVIFTGSTLASSLPIRIFNPTACGPFIYTSFRPKPTRPLALTRRAPARTCQQEGKTRTNRRRCGTRGRKQLWRRRSAADRDPPGNGQRPRIGGSGRAGRPRNTAGRGERRGLLRPGPG